MKTDKKWMRIAILCASVFSATVLLDYLGVFIRLEYIVYDRAVKHFRYEKQLSDKVAVILIDERSLQYLDPEVGRWPWPRAVYSDLFEFLSMGGPEAVFMDILFTETEEPRKSGKLGDQDRQFVSATHDSGFVYHAMQLVVDKEDEVNKLDLNRPLPEDFVSKFSLNVKRSAAVMKSPNNAYYMPFKELYGAAHGMAVVEFKPDADGVYRSTHLLMGYGGSLFSVPGIAPMIKNQPMELSEKSLTIGGKRIPLDRNGSYAINFYGYDKYKSYSMSGILESQKKILAGKIENLPVHPDEFSGKIVFVGASAVGVEDLKPTPISPKTPGVYLHASLASNFIQGDFLYPPDRNFTIFSILLFTSICVPGIFYIKKFTQKIMLPVVLLTAWAIFYYVNFSNNQLYDFVPPSFAILLSTISMFGYLMMTEGREKTKARKMFSQYVSEEVLSEVMDNYGDMATAGVGKKDEISILFADIRSFTSFSDKRPPEKVVEMLNCYFSHMSDVIKQQRGCLDKFIGDAIMAHWGALIKTDDHADRGVTAAINMIGQLQKINEEIKKMDVGDFELKIGIGINSGDAIIGNIGSEKKLDYTVIGDTVNLASRLEAQTKNYGVKIIISEFTYKRLKGDFLCRVIDTVQVRGKEDKIKIYEPMVFDGGGGDAKRSLEKAKALCDTTNRAFDLYQNGDYKTALGLYRSMEDGNLREMFIERCEQGLVA